MFSFTAIIETINRLDNKVQVKHGDAYTSCSLRLPTGGEILTERTNDEVEVFVTVPGMGQSHAMPIDDQEVCHQIHQMLLNREFNDDDLLDQLAPVPPTQEEIKSQVLQGLTDAKEMMVMATEVMKSEEFKDLTTEIINVAAEARTQTSIFQRGVDAIFGRKKTRTKKTGSKST
jgi:hypothetical protein